MAKRRRIRFWWHNPPTETGATIEYLNGTKSSREAGPRTVLTLEEVAAAIAQTFDVAWTVADVRSSIRNGFLRTTRDGRRVTLQALKAWVDQERRDAALMKERRNGPFTPWEQIRDRYL